jgi:hypothetical protein
VTVQVYMLSYRESMEVVKFQQSATREKQSFINLIEKKAHLVLPMDEVGITGLGLSAFL